MKYPMQPITGDAHGVIRFECNPIVDWLCTEKSNMNEIAIYASEHGISEKYQQQIAQLVGYSVSGYGSLSYVDDESYDRACNAVVEIKQLAALQTVTPEMLRAAQLNTEIGQFVCSEWSEAYSLITELYLTMVKAALKQQDGD